MIFKTVHLAGSAQLECYVPDAEIGYRVRRRRPGIILAPGGAYLIYGTREREGVALEFLAKGYNVYILLYSLGFSSREVREQHPAALDTAARYPLPVLEMMCAVHYVKEHQDELNLDADRLFLLGFSAGAHVCAACGVHWNAPEFVRQLNFVPGPDELKAAGMILGYPMLNPVPERIVGINDPDNPDTALITEFLFGTQTPSEEQKQSVNLTGHVTPQTVPAFIWHSTDDPVVYAGDSTRFVLALQENGVDCEYHLFSGGGHGLALGTEPYAQRPADVRPDIAIWTDLAHAWMRRVAEQAALAGMLQPGQV